MLTPDGVARHGDVELAYWDRGSGPETLLLIMGIVQRAAFWRPSFIEALASEYRVLCFDNRGTGSSTRDPDLPITADLWVKDALAVLDAAGVSRTHIIGYSMGGRVTQQLLVDEPKRVDRVVMLAAAVGGPEGVPPEPRAMAAFAGDPQQPPEQQRYNAMVGIAGRGFAERDPEAAAEYVALGAEKRTPLQVIGKQIGVAKTDVAERLARTTAPMLIVHGDDDPLVPVANGERLKRIRPDADFIKLAGCGHCVQFEAEQALLDAVFTFLKR